jgi:hypothetical protein
MEGPRRDFTPESNFSRHEHATRSLDSELESAMDATFMEKDAWKFLYKLMIKEDQLAVECRKSSRLEEALDSTRAQLSSANAKIAGILRLSKSA